MPVCVLQFACCQRTIQLAAHHAFWIAWKASVHKRHTKLHENASLFQMLPYITLHTLPTKNTMFWIVIVGQTGRKSRTRCTEAYPTEVHWVTFSLLYLKDPCPMRCDAVGTQRRFRDICHRSFWWQLVPLQSRYTSNRLQGVTSHKTGIFTLSVVRISNVNKFKSNFYKFKQKTYNYSYNIKDSPYMYYVEK